MQELEKHLYRNVVSGRSLLSYEIVLGFKKAELEGKKILNFGSGGSNLSKELRAQGIQCEVVDVDILPNPHSVHDGNLPPEEEIVRSRIMERKVQEDREGQLQLKPVEEYENSLLGIENRNFVQLDTTGKLPFPDNSFDEVFVSWAYHQIGKELRESYLKELMRVSNRILISPIGRTELQEIQNALQNSSFEIESLIHYSQERGSQTKEVKKKSNREKGLTDDGHLIYELDIDYSERPYSVNSAGCARIVLKRKIT